VDKLKGILRRFGTDIAGYACLVLVIFIGPLPGPGGIPLLVAGLGLLSVNNEWARKLLDYVKKHSSSLRDVLFPKNKRIELIWDILLTALFFGAFALSVNTERWYLRAICTGIAAISTTALLFNRSRLEKLQNRFRKH
jgi:hypothetical protein